MRRARENFCQAKSNEQTSGSRTPPCRPLPSRRESVMPVRLGSSVCGSRHLLAPLAALLTLVLMGCGTERENAGPKPQPAVRTDSARPRDATPPSDANGSLTVTPKGMEMGLDGGYYSLKVPFVYVNRRSTPVGNPGCNPPLPPRLQWWNGLAWVDAHVYETDACRSAPFILAPSARHATITQFRIPRDSVDPSGRLARDYWWAPLDAWFRLSWDLIEPREPVGLDDGPPIPERERVSAPFRLPLRD